MSVDTERIKEIENNFVNLKPKVIIQASCSRFNIEEIKEIVEVCRENDIEITESVFLKSAEKLKKMWNI